MSKKKKDTVESVEVSNDPFLKLDELFSSDTYKNMHYGFIHGDAFDAYEDEKISTGSARMDIMFGGGYRPGISLFYGEPETGKTAQGLVWAKNWQDKYGDKARVIFFDAEGRLSKYKIEMSGIDLKRFSWARINYGEKIYDSIEKAIMNNPGGYKFFFIIDSINAIQRIADKDKSYEDNAKIAGGASLNSTAYSRLSGPINALGHHLYICSQIRTQNIGGPGAGKGESAKASGGKAPQFYGDIIGKFHKAWSGTLITENDSKDESEDSGNKKAPKTAPLGNRTRILFTKSYNEISNSEIDIPIKFKHVGGIWREYEAYMAAIEWSLINKSGAWYNFTDLFRSFCEQDNVTFKNVDLNKKIQGERNLILMFEEPENSDLVEYILAKIKALSL